MTLESRGEEDPARLSPGGNRTLHRVPLPLAVREWVLHAPYEAHEKGGIEGAAGYFRRNHLRAAAAGAGFGGTERPAAPACQQDERRQIAGHRQPVGAAMIAERAHLLALAEHGFELAELSFPRVDGLGCVRVRTNLYSVPAKPGRTVEVRIYPSYVEVRDEGRGLARHEHCYERNQQELTALP
jgi:hypothetical protein